MPRQSIIDRARLIDLDIGCGRAKQPGYVGLDYQRGPGVDIVWNISRTPWKPIQSMSCRRLLMSHVIEHIPPEKRFAVIDECWRIIHPTGQLFIACPYAGSMYDTGHLEHYPSPNEWAFHFFDPEYHFWRTRLPHAKPWKIIKDEPTGHGCLEVIMEPRKTPKGRPIIPKKTGFLVSTF